MQFLLTLVFAVACYMLAASFTSAMIGVFLIGMFSLNLAPALKMRRGPVLLVFGMIVLFMSQVPL